MKKLLLGILAAVLTLALVSSPVAAKPGMDKLLPATDIELVKRATIHGERGSAGKPAPGASTGLLGQLALGNKYAIVIGISDYPGTANDLSYCDEDARDMVSALTSLHGYDAANIISLIDLNASFDNIKNAVNDIKGRVAADSAPAQAEVVFFFSGHGAKGKFADDDAQDKLQGVDSNGTDEAIVCHNGSQNGQLRDWFNGFGTSRIIFVFDSCLAGGMTDLASSGRVINMACSETGVSYESSSWGGGHGQFTYYFVDQGMLSGLADKYDYDRDGKLKEPGDVSIEEAFDYAKANCLKQTPSIRDSFINDLLL
ncbi:MAG: caspase family protein [Chloroflexi bacterium]|nr:caspase family protein [Chloroflexota bacterium]